MSRMPRPRFCLNAGHSVPFALCFLLALSPRIAPAQTTVRQYRAPGQPIAARPDGAVLCEAEEFQVLEPGWKPKPWGTNYYAATLANTFLSRKAYLGAPEQADGAVAAAEVVVPEAGRYLALVRYEAVYRFQTRFTLRIEQQGKVKLERLYGARDNNKIWAFGNKIKAEAAWPWPGRFLKPLRAGLLRS